MNAVRKLSILLSYTATESQNTYGFCAFSNCDRCNALANASSSLCKTDDCTIASDWIIKGDTVDVGQTLPDGKNTWTLKPIISDLTSDLSTRIRFYLSSGSFVFRVKLEFGKKKRVERVRSSGKHSSKQVVITFHMSTQHVAEKPQFFIKYSSSLHQCIIAHHHTEEIHQN